MAKKDKNKFAFGTDFQQEILHYIIKDKNGILALNQVKDSYFDGLIVTGAPVENLPFEAVD